MAGVVHIIAPDTTDDMLRQVETLAGETETIVSVGPLLAPRRFARRVVSVRAPVGSARLAAMELRGLADGSELLHAWSPMAAAAARFAARGRPILLSVSRLRPIHQADAIISGAFDGLWSLTVPTAAQRQTLITLGLDDEIVFVLRPAVRAPDDPAAGRRSVRDELGLDDHHFVLVAPSQMLHPAGHKEACWAHAMARTLVDNLRLICPGSGPAVRTARNFAVSTGYDDEIFFTAERFDPSDILAAGDAGVFLHRRDSGVGALVQAMSAGLAILGSDRPEIAECAPAPRTALLSPPGDMRLAADNLLKLMADADLRGTLARCAAEMATRRFDPETAAGELRSIYAAVALA